MAGQDVHSIAGKSVAVAERTQLLVVGAGPAGLAAAIEAASAGRTVILVDENPIAAETMGDDIPLHFGSRMSGGARNRNAMMEALLAARPRIAEAFELGVDVRLGVTCWGLYANGESVGWLPGPVAGLSEGARAWMLGFDECVVATGRRDMGLAFAGWEKPGVMGASAASLLASLGALAARRAVVLGSGAEACLAAKSLIAAGIDVAAIVEHASEPLCPEALPEGVTRLCGHAVLRAEGAREVERLIVAPLAEDGRPQREAARSIEADTVVIGIGAVPVIDLLDGLGARIVFDAARGGYVPQLGAGQATSVAGIRAAGDCAGVWNAKSLDANIAEAEGRAAINADAVDAPPHVTDFGAYRLGWVRACVLPAGDATHVCQCEEVTAREILEVRPPRYLNWPERARNDRDLETLLGNGPPNPDQVKRLTRAGMGLCQGRRCREQVACLLALEADADLSRIPLAGYRAPVRPLSLAVAASLPESAAMAAHWHTWFGIDGQMTPYWLLDKPGAEIGGWE